MSTMERLKVSLMSEIENIQQAAVLKKAVMRELGVFILFADESGDAWLLEMTDQDAVQLAAAGKAITPPIDENPETIEINWSNTFLIRDRRLHLTAYEDNKEQVLEGAPTQKINAAIRRLHKIYSAKQLDQVHLNQGV